LGNYKNLSALGGSGNKLNPRVGRGRRAFYLKRQKSKLFFEYGLLFAFRSFAIEEKKSA
jgi:hypothetical protein